MHNLGLKYTYNGLVRFVAMLFTYGMEKSKAGKEQQKTEHVSLSS